MKDASRSMFGFPRSRNAGGDRLVAFELQCACGMLPARFDENSPKPGRSHSCRQAMLKRGSAVVRRSCAKAAGKQGFYYLLPPSGYGSMPCKKPGSRSLSERLGDRKLDTII